MDSSLRTVAIFPKSLIFGLSTLPKHSLGSWRNEKMRVERYLMVSPFSFAESCNKGWVRVSKQRMSSVNILVPRLLSLPPLRESPGNEAILSRKEKSLRPVAMVSASQQTVVWQIWQEKTTFLYMIARRNKTVTHTLLPPFDNANREMLRFRNHSTILT